MSTFGDLSWLQATVAQAEGASSDYDLNPDAPALNSRELRPAAVLIGIANKSGVPCVLLTKRPSTMKHHPGQIAFPGGKQDPLDKDLEQTALREALEEVGLKAQDAQLVGALSPHETVTQFQVHPFVFQLDADFSPEPDAQEVAEVFWVPLAFLSDPANFQIQSRRWRGVRRYYYAVPFGPYYIWGATARMLYSFAVASVKL